MELNYLRNDRKYHDVYQNLLVENILNIPSSYSESGINSFYLSFSPCLTGFIWYFVITDDLFTKKI